MFMKGKFSLHRLLTPECGQRRGEKQEEYEDQAENDTGLGSRHKGRCPGETRPP